MRTEEQTQMQQNQMHPQQRRSALQLRGREA